MTAPGPRRVRRLRGADVALDVTEVGDPAAPAVLLGHGVGSSRAFLVEAFAGPFVAAGWRLVAHDLRGHGGATAVRDPSGYGLAHLAADVAALAGTVRPQVVGGVSLGGMAATAFVAWGGTAEAVVACLPAWTGRAVPGTGPHAAVAREVAGGGVAAMAARVAADTAMPRWLRAVLLRDWPRHDARSLAAALAALDGGRAPSVAELGRLCAPLAVVSWPHDPGHPTAVATTWAGAAPRASHHRTTLAAVGGDRAALGRAAVAALAELGIAPLSS